MKRGRRGRVQPVTGPRRLTRRREERKMHQTASQVSIATTKTPQMMTPNGAYVNPPQSLSLMYGIVIFVPKSAVVEEVSDRVRRGRVGKRTSEDVDWKEGQTDDVKLDKGHVGTALGAGEGESKNAKVGGVVVRKDGVVENE
jgi:hypothetical protein